MAKKMTYKQALVEINNIIDEIENGEIDVDILEQKLKKAKELFAFCQNKLKKAQDATNNILDELSDSE